MSPCPPPALDSDTTVKRGSARKNEIADIRFVKRPEGRTRPKLIAQPGRATVIVGKRSERRRCGTTQTLF